MSARPPPVVAVALASRSSSRGPGRAELGCAQPAGGRAHAGAEHVVAAEVGARRRERLGERRAVAGLRRGAKIHERILSGTAAFGWQGYLPGFDKQVRVPEHVIGASGAPPTASRAPASAPSLLSQLQTGGRRAAVTFAGQGGAPLAELATLVAQRPELRAGLTVAADVLAEAAASPAGQAGGRFRHGVDLVAWAEDPAAAPPAAYLRSASVSYPLILVTQALLWRAVWEDGLREAMRDGAIVAAAGHSQGLLAALLVAEAGAGGIDDALLARYVRLAWTVGTHAALAARSGPEPPLVAISGLRLARLEPVLRSVNAEVGDADAISVALVNTARRIVVGGPPPTLALLRARLAEQARSEQAERRSGRRGGAPLRFGWTPLDVDVAFHTPALREPCALLRAQLAAEPGLLPDPAMLALPVLSPGDGRDLRAAGDLAATVAVAQLVTPVDWQTVSRCLADAGADWVLDFGPGTDVAALTAENLRGHGARTLALASPEGRRRLSSPGAAATAPDVRYASFAPGVVELPDGRRHLDGRYTRLTGRPPVILAGMTPTTADAPIVAAAANAGYTAELAGGGQPDRWTFERRIDELRELLEPGREVVFNTLLLDRHLWQLHVARERLVLDARRGGAPLAGLTISAGVPDVDEALALLDELAAAGLRLNAFKPGTVEQVRQVLAIADAAPQHTIAVHLEGGLGGGHHSWEELDELLLETYHELRGRGNVLLCVGGGVGDPARAADLLCGTWSLVYDEPAMPVDAVLVGTAAMACAEAAASAQVKQALVAARGSEDWVLRGASAGGVTSARSTLDADIHLLDTAAARAAHLLDQVAGDAAAVAARRDEIVAALARTAKPYIGDVEAMSYRELLARFTGAVRDRPRRALRRRRLGSPDLARPRAGAVPPLRRAPASARRRPHRAPARAARRAARRSGRRARGVLRRVPGGRDDAAAPGRRAVLPRGLRPARQAGAVRAGARRRGAPLADGRRAVAGAGRPAGRGRRGRHPRSALGRRHHPRRRADRRAARALRGRGDRPGAERRRGAAPARPARRSGARSGAAGRRDHRLRRPRRGALRGPVPARRRAWRRAARAAQPAVAARRAGRRGACGARRAGRSGVPRGAAGGAVAVSGCTWRGRTASSRSRCRCPRSTGRPRRSRRAGGRSTAGRRSPRSTATRA